MDKKKWILCPVCGSKTRNRVRMDTILENFPLYCPKCKQETLIRVKNLNMIVIKEPEHYDHILFGEKYIYVIQDFSAFGGIYGNSKDPTLFLRDEKSEKTTKIDNPLKIAERKVMLLEAAVGVSHEKHLFQSFTVYNNSLLVPPTIQVKDGANSLLPLKDLKQTIIEAEKDSVTSFEDQKTKDLVLAIKERSDAVKKDVQKRKKLAKKSR